jgi:UDP-N-acetylmuramoyl-L-alanyl-D-glutamate--2,6-diaminopimelate ligase
MKKLEQILSVKDALEVIGSLDATVNDITFDSRQVTKGSCFIAVRGTQADGHGYIDKAIEQGASVIVCEDLPEKRVDGVTYARVKDTTEVLGLMATAFYDNPSQKLKLVGITGTNGKTTTVTLLYRLFNKLGFKSGLLSTVVNYIGDEEIPATHTTPDSIQLNKLLAQMVEAGCSHCFMEVSSHAIVQNRIAGLKFTGALFSNITHDHLDYHKTFDEYLRAKKRFFDLLPADAFALINIDDRNGRVMVQNTEAKVSSYSLRSMANYKCKVIENHFDGMLLNLDSIEVWTRLVGGFNAYNILAIYSAARLLGVERDIVLTEISSMTAVSGRFEHMKSPKGINVVVDYAHTPDALQNVIDTINEIKTPENKLISVVGAGGNRDKTKRPVMAKVAVEGSGMVILTSDNPRFEEPEEILKDMKTGIEPSMVGKVLTIVDRREAIRTAYMLATPGDIVLVAGKGHENYQEIKGVKHHFDDKEVIQEIMNIENYL